MNILKRGMYLCICVCIYKYIYAQSNDKVYVITLYDKQRNKGKKSDEEEERNWGSCSRRRFIILIIISSLLTFTYTIVFILLGVGCLLSTVLSERRSCYRAVNQARPFCVERVIFKSSVRLLYKRSRFVQVSKFYLNRVRDLHLLPSPPPSLSLNFYIV